MENVDELPTWAARAHEPGSNLPATSAAPEPPPKRRGGWVRGLLFGLLGLLALAGMAALGYVAATVTAGDDDATEASGSSSSIASEAAAADTDADDATATDAGSDGDAEAAGATTDEADTAADEMADTSGDTDSADGAETDADDDTAGATDGAGSDATAGEVVENSDGSIRYAVIQGGQIYLRGRVPSAEMGAQIEAAATQVLGEGNVFNEYEVDPTTPEVEGGPVYVEDVVLFEFNSIEIAPPFLPILDLGTILLQVNPTASITVVSRTDSVGSAEVNQQVSELRAQAVVDYWASQGADLSRVTIDARGEEEAAAEGDADAAALDRRVEFIISDLLG